MEEQKENRIKGEGGDKRKMAKKKIEKWIPNKRNEGVEDKSVRFKKKNGP